MLILTRKVKKENSGYININIVPVQWLEYNIYIV